MFFTENERLETLRACRDCPMCYHIDPVAAITGKETNTPRGRARILWGLEKGILSWDDDGVADVLYKAVLDGLAQEWCEGNYDYDELVIDGRRRLVEIGKSLPEVTNILRNIMNTGNPFGLTEKGVNHLVKNAGGSAKGNPEVILFLGSSARVYRPQVVFSVVKIMRLLEIPFETLPKEVDSGFVLYQLGSFKAAADHAKNVAEMLKLCKAKRLVTLGASDYRMFNTRYSRFGAFLPEGMTVMHITEFLWQLLSEKSIVFERKFPEKITYHDPCSLGRFTYLLDPPRKLLSALAGVNFVEMEWNGRKAHCCGGGGGLAFTFPEISEKASRMRIEGAIRTGARILTSSCPECEQILSRTVSKDEIVVKDVLELVADAL